MEKSNKRMYGSHLTSTDIFQEYILPDIKPILKDYTWIDLYAGEGNLILPILTYADGPFCRTIVTSIGTCVWCWVLFSLTPFGERDWVHWCDPSKYEPQTRCRQSLHCRDSVHRFGLPGTIQHWLRGSDRLYASWACTQ